MQASCVLRALFLATFVGTAALADETPERVDLLTFAQGVLPVSIDTGAEDLRTGAEHAIYLIDGNPLTRVMTPKPGSGDAGVEITYALPAPTIFDRFAVPDVSETKSPSQTFFANVEISGASDSVDGPYVVLADATLQVPDEEGAVIEVPLSGAPSAVRWVKVRLSGGTSVERDKTFFEFSEIIAHGTQDIAPMSDRFTGTWKGRGVNIELEQDGSLVTGCYDKKDKLEGTIQGNVLRALGQDASSGVVSQFILIAAEDGSLRGLRSTNGAPFKPYDGEQTGAAPVCLAPDPPQIGCGSVVHGIGFDFDSDVLRADAAPVLAKVFEGLSAETAPKIEIVGHSSSEGAADYNRDLSERRAASVVTRLVSMGFDAGALSFSGRGEDEPIASNDDEAGRSLNRRVEIRCSS